MKFQIDYTRTNVALGGTEVRTVSGEIPSTEGEVMLHAIKLSLANPHHRYTVYIKTCLEVRAPLYTVVNNADRTFTVTVAKDINTDKPEVTE